MKRARPLIRLPRVRPRQLAGRCPLGYIGLMEAPHTVIETSEFLAAAKAHLTEQERLAVIRAVSRDPKAGNVMAGTGGARKLRVARGNNIGKSGGFRVIYLYHDQTVPLFLFTVYPKGAKDNLTKAERNALKQVNERIVQAYKSGVKQNVRRLRKHHAGRD